MYYWRKHAAHAPFLAGIMLLYGDYLLQLTAESANTPMTNYVPLALLLFTYMFFRRAYRLVTIGTPGRPRADLLGGFLLLSLSMSLHLYSYFLFHTLRAYLNMVSLSLLIAGYLSVNVGLGALLKLVPVLLLPVLAVPPPQPALYYLGSYLSWQVARISATLAGLSIQVELSEAYGSPLISGAGKVGDFRFLVDVACSGIYSLLGFTIFAYFYALSKDCGILRKIAFFAAGLGLFMALNVARIYSIVMVGYYMGEGAALGVYHSISGVVLIAIGGAMLVAMFERVTEYRRSGDDAECKGHVAHESGLCLLCGRAVGHRPRVRKAALIYSSLILAVALLGSLVGIPAAAVAQGSLRLQVSPSHSNEILPGIEGWRLKYGWRDRSFERISGQDFTIFFVYEGGDKRDTTWVLLEVADYTLRLHTWETCIAYQPSGSNNSTPVVVELYEVDIAEDPPIVGRWFVYRPPGTDMLQAILYWYERLPFNINGTLVLKMVKISLIRMLAGGSEVDASREEMLFMARNIVDYWRPARTASPLVLRMKYILPGVSLATIIALLWVAAGSLLYRWMRGRSLSRKMGEIENPLAKKLLSSLHALGGAAKGIELCMYMSADVSPRELIEQLLYLREQGLVDTSISLDSGGPRLRWVSNLVLLPGAGGRKHLSKLKNLTRLRRQ